MTLTEVINQAIIKKNRESADKHTTPRIYPSSIGRCSREIVYQMLGYSGIPEEPIALMRMENGTYFHNRIENLLRDNDIFIADEYTIVNKEDNISGRSDILIKNIYPHEPSSTIITLYKPLPRTLDGEEDTSAEPEILYQGPDNDIMIVELKSIKSKGYSYLIKDNKPKREHVMQLQLYMDETGIRAGLLLYENKDTQAMKEFIVHYNPEVVKAVREQIALINRYTRQNELPPREFTQADIECQYCKYREKCWTAEDKVDLHKLF